MRTSLMRQVAPQIGFPGEKNFNPVYMMLQVCDNYPVLLMNEVLCNVEYQLGADSMSQGIWRQYANSARSVAKLRLLEMGLKRNNFRNKMRVCVHYISSCLLSRDKKWLSNSPLKIMTLLLLPMKTDLLNLKQKIRKRNLLKLLPCLATLRLKKSVRQRSLL